jgi:glycosyltransferase involved in cell wall biosynthesis
MASWTICSAEYPPDCGGVGDYTALVARELAAAGDRVLVCVPRRPDGRALTASPGVETLELSDRFGPASRRELTRRLAGVPTKLLVQYVPNVFGLRGANLPWCRWLRRRGRAHGDDVRVMFHEPYFYFDWRRPDRSALAVVQRAMAATLVEAATRAYISTAAWDRYLGAAARRAGVPLTVLPVCSSIPRSIDPRAVAELRDRQMPRGISTLVGHFGTYGAHIAPLLHGIVPALLAADERTAALCMGPGSQAFVDDAARLHPHLGHRLAALGRLPAADVADAIAACDLMVQPFPDGATTRRTSLMAALVNGRAVVTTTGALTEPIWAETAAVALAPAGDVGAVVAKARALIADSDARAELGARADATYRAEFALEHVVARLRADTGTGGSPLHRAASAAKGAAA